MDVHEFIHKWQKSELKESAASQEHFIDLCHLLNEPTPAEVDSVGTWYTFEKGANKLDGSKGFADVWKKDCFAWEYKGKHKNLDEAYVQLLKYRSSLNNPPLLIVSDMETIKIYTNFTSTAEKLYTITLADLENGDKMHLLKCIFNKPDQLRPDVTTEQITQTVAEKLGGLAETLRNRGHNHQDVAHFLSKLIFCMFAQNIELLPTNLLKDMVSKSEGQPAEFVAMLKELFLAMNTGDRFGIDKIRFFNGGLFDDDLVIPLEQVDLDILAEASGLDWGKVDPSIFGTLFERGFDPTKRAQLGKHYTGRDDIEKIILPTIFDPLRQKWHSIEALVDEHLEKICSVQPRHQMSPKEKEQETKIRKEASRLINCFLDSEVRALRVLDPACGSGNFLYVALEKLHDIEKLGLAKLSEIEFGQLPWSVQVSPRQLYGIEINQYACELAQVTIWIGHLQWMKRNGFPLDKNPILEKHNNFSNTNAILVFDETQKKGSIPKWPDVDVIIGNPPFLGCHKFREQLDKEAAVLFAAYKGKVSGKSDLVCYWFYLALQCLKESSAKRVGFVSTNSIRGGANRKILDEINKDGTIFDAWSDEKWAVDGANVRVSLVCFARKEIASEARLNGKSVDIIYSDLTPRLENKSTNCSIDADPTKAQTLQENLGVAFKGTTRNGPFDITGEQARKWLCLPLNVNGHPNSLVLKPFANAIDITRTSVSDRWIIDFDVNMSQADAAQFEAPFEYVQKHVIAARTGYEKKKKKCRLGKFWLYEQDCPAMRSAIKRLTRYIVTPRHSKHRIFVWVPATLIPDGALFAICREDDVTFGILHSRFHNIWIQHNHTSIGVGNTPRYTTTTCFDKFPFPAGMNPSVDPTLFLHNPLAQAIAKAAKHLNELRQAWLFPADCITLKPEVVQGFPDRILPQDENAKSVLKKRTLTHLYNESPQWLIDAHTQLDISVAEAYGWSNDMPDDEVFTSLLNLNYQRVHC